jgi:hypothetical protein
MIQLPLIHLNGTAACDLRDGYVAAYRAVTLAREALSKIEFNARDYYLIQDAWPMALKEMEARHTVLRQMAADLLTIAEHAADHVKE